MIYRYSFYYPRTYFPQTVKSLLKELLLPRKWRHYLRVEQAVLVNGQYRYFNQKVYPGDKITISLNHVDTRQGLYPPSGHLPQVVYEDQNVLVINKPAGQKTHPNQEETNTALNDCATYLGKNPFIVHRLDKLTSGLLLVAKNPAVVPILNKELVNKSLQRQYLAKIKLKASLADEGTINRPLGHDPTDQRKRMVRPDGHTAITHYRIVRKNKGFALLQLKLETGRTHQIRVHLASIGCPIIGDPLYNPAYQKGEKLQLLAYRLSFIRPFSFQRKTVSLL